MVNRGSGASGDVLVLNEDGTVTIGWDKVTATLRRPTAGEWLSFMEEIEAADAWARGETDNDEDREPVAKSIREALADGPYLMLYRRMLIELADVEVATSDMPPWLALGPTASRISNWWVASPLHRAEAAAATRTLSQ